MYSSGISSHSVPLCCPNQITWPLAALALRFSRCDLLRSLCLDRFRLLLGFFAMLVSRIHMPLMRGIYLWGRSEHQMRNGFTSASSVPILQRDIAQQNKFLPYMFGQVWAVGDQLPNLLPTCTQLTRLHHSRWVCLF